ncbi:MAG: hypothetical protein J3R72DRAFT_458677 [Linnemannia gamsii]|nr:MAG: hypothetical protein J3R72DRAFT_458677 [Linnemannia gamsii]
MTTRLFLFLFNSLLVYNDAPTRHPAPTTHLIPPKDPTPQERSRTHLPEPVLPLYAPPLSLQHTVSGLRCSSYFCSLLYALHVLPSMTAAGPSNILLSTVFKIAARNLAEILSRTIVQEGATLIFATSGGLQGPNSLSAVKIWHHSAIRKVVEVEVEMQVEMKAVTVGKKETPVRFIIQGHYTGFKLVHSS